MVMTGGQVRLKISSLLRDGTISEFLNSFKHEFTIVILTHYKPRIVVAIIDL